MRNEHPKLAVEPTIVVPPQVQLASNNMPNFGDPWRTQSCLRTAQVLGAVSDLVAVAASDQVRALALVPVKAAAQAAEFST